jgi:hypothetical protein
MSNTHYPTSTAQGGRNYPSDMVGGADYAATTPSNDVEQNPTTGANGDTTQDQAFWDSSAGNRGNQAGEPGVQESPPGYPVVDGGRVTPDDGTQSAGGGDTSNNGGTPSDSGQNGGHEAQGGGDTQADGGNAGGGSNGDDSGNAGSGGDHAGGGDDGPSGGGHGSSGLPDLGHVTQTVEGLRGPAGGILGGGGEGSGVSHLLGNVTGVLDPILGSGNGDGESGGVSHLLGNVTGLLDPVLGGQHDGSDSGLLGALPLDGLGLQDLSVGDGGALQPVGGIANVAVDDVHTVSEIVGHTLGVPNLTHAITGTGEATGLGNINIPDGGHDIVTDVLNAPNDLLVDGDSPVGVVENLVHDVNGFAANEPLSGIVQGALTDLPSPLVNVAADGDGPGGTQHVVNVDVGPQQDNGLIADVLVPNDDGPHHAVEANVLTTGGPQVVNADLLNGGDALQFPNLGGQGADGLVGAVTSTVLGSVTGGGEEAHGSGLGGVLDVVDLGGGDNGDGQQDGHHGITGLLANTLHGHGLGLG